MNRSRLPAAALGVAATLLTGALAHAQVLLQWNTFGNGGHEVIEPSVFNDPNLATSELLNGAGINTAGNSNRMGGTGWMDSGDSNPSPLAEAIPDNDYFQFTVTPLGGTAMTITSFVFSWDHSSTGPHSVTLRSSLDEFESDLGSVLNMPASLTTGNTITLTGLDALTGPVMFRLFGWGASAFTGSGGFDTAVNAPNVQLNGFTTIPEPSTYAWCLGFGTLGFTLWRRRRRSGGAG